jgi:hypothetical protein
MCQKLIIQSIGLYVAQMRVLVVIIARNISNILKNQAFCINPRSNLGLEPKLYYPLESFSAKLPILFRKHEIVIPREFSFCRLRLTPVAAVGIGEIRDEKAFSVSS